MFFKRDILTKKVVLDFEKLEVFLMIQFLLSLLTMAVAIAAYARSL